jgi:hypothetical protein
MPIDTNHPRRLRAALGARSCFALLAFCFAALPLAIVTATPRASVTTGKSRRKPRSRGRVR